MNLNSCWNNNNFHTGNYHHSPSNNQVILIYRNNKTQYHCLHVSYTQSRVCIMFDMCWALTELSLNIQITSPQSYSNLLTHHTRSLDRGKYGKIIGNTWSNIFIDLIPIFACKNLFHFLLIRLSIHTIMPILKIHFNYYDDCNHKLYNKQNCTPQHFKLKVAQFSIKQFK